MPTTLTLTDSGGSPTIVEFATSYSKVTPSGGVTGSPTYILGSSTILMRPGAPMYLSSEPPPSPVGIGNTYAKDDLDDELGSGTPSTWYGALLTTLPGDGDGTGLVEVSATGYSRMAITNNSTNFPAASVVNHVATKKCQLLLSWGPLSGLGSPLTIVGVALYTASSGGNLGRIAVPGTPAQPLSAIVTNGQEFAIAAGDLTFMEV